MVPLVEIYVIIQVGQVIGPWWTILLLIADSILGSWLIKREGGRAWRALRTALKSGRMPAKELADGIADPGRRHPHAHPGLRHRRLRASCCILPFTRPVFRRLLTTVVTRKLIVVGTGAAAGFAGPGHARRPGPGPEGPVVQGEVIDDRPTSLRQARERRASGPYAASSCVAAVQVRGADLSATEQLEPLGEDVLELLHRAALEQHVPVGADRLLGLHLTLDAGRALPSAPQRGHSHSAGMSASTDMVISNRGRARRGSRPADEQRTRFRARPRSSGLRVGRHVMFALP